MSVNYNSFENKSIPKGFVLVRLSPDTKSFLVKAGKAQGSVEWIDPKETIITKKDYYDE